MCDKIFKLAKLRYLFDEETRITIYRQCILPHADYCSFMTDLANKTLIKRLDVIQRQALRICTKTKIGEMHCEELLNYCAIPDLFKRRKEMLATFLYRKSKKDNIKNNKPKTRGQEYLTA